MKTNLSFTGLLLRLVGQAPKPVDALVPTEQQGKLTTSIRLAEGVRHFYEAQAEHLGISLQECLALTLTGVMRSSWEPQASELELQVDRFFSLFEEHGIAATDIPAILKDCSDIEKSDLLERRLLLNKLNKKIFTTLSSLFYIEIGWLRGERVLPYQREYRLYKNAFGIARYLTIAKRENRNVRVLFIVQRNTSTQILQRLYEAYRRGDDIQEVNVKVIVELEKVVNGVSLKTYDVFDELRWNYVKCRRDIKLIMMFCNKTGIRFDGYELPEAAYSSLRNNSILAASVLNGKRDLWYADQLMWNDERNLEQDELSSIGRYYSSEKLDIYEDIYKDPDIVRNWDDFKSGKYDINVR